MAVWTLRWSWYPTAGHDLTAAHPHSNWVFRDSCAGQPIRAGSLRDRPRGLFSTQAARLGTLHEITNLTPVAIIAEALATHDHN
jgi:hypothetical protein